MQNLPAMETVKFTPDKAAIEVRAAIVPYGRGVNYEPVKPEPIEFSVVSREQEKECDKFEPIAPVAPPTSAYVPPIMKKPNFAASNVEIAVRVTNIPLDKSSREIQDIFLSKCGRTFTRCTLVFDKETKKSRGIAYVNFSDKEKASEFAKKAADIVVDNFKLGVEILDRR